MFLFLFSILMFVQKRPCFADVYHLSRTPPTCHRRLPPGTDNHYPSRTPTSVMDTYHLSKMPTTCHGKPKAIYSSSLWRTLWAIASQIRKKS